MLIELRRYSVGTGHMDDMHSRMHKMLMPLFREHGVPQPLAIWENRDQTSIFTWMLPWESFESRQHGWARFYPSFYAARSAENTEEFVQGANVNLVTPWSKDELSFPKIDGTCELAWHVQPQVNYVGSFQAFCMDSQFGIFTAAGASAVVAMTLMFGPMPRMMIISSWPSLEDRRIGLQRLADMKVPGPIADAIQSSQSVLDHGLWERLDRAQYL